MKVSTKNIKEIKRRLEILYSKFNIDYYSENDVKLGDEDIFISFPDDHLDEPYDLEDFLLYTERLDDVVIEDESSVRSGCFRQVIITLDSYHFAHLIPKVMFENEIISLQIVENPFLIGIAASKDFRYNDHFGISPCSGYLAIELKYKSEKRLTKEEENKAIKSFLYYISSKFDVSAGIGYFYEWEDITEEEPEDNLTVLTKLLPYSEGMDYYTRAIDVENLEIQYLYLYKIIEYYSPIVSKKEAYESLNQRLDSLNVCDRDYQFMDSILHLAKRFDDSLKDKEIAKTVLLNCVDVLPLFSELPERIRKQLSKRFNFKESEFQKINDSLIIEIKKEIGEIIYATRNMIVHAKSNYNTSGKECKSEEMEEMNAFMKKLCQCLIAWNSRQPKEFRI